MGGGFTVTQNEMAVAMIGDKDTVIGFSLAGIKTAFTVPDDDNENNWEVAKQAITSIMT